MSEVVLKNVSKVYPGNVVAVKNIDLKVEDQEFLVLVGPSGCGKSTILRMIAGLEDATTGDIYIDGKLVNQLPPKGRDTAMVFQNYALYPHMSVYQNLAFSLKLRKYAKSEIDKRVKEAAEILGIGALLDRKPKALSGGERQRVAVGRAIVRHPKAFLFDEPLSNLDAKLRVQMRAEISKLHHRLQATMIYVTHDQVEAMTMGDKIAVLNHGQIQQIADPLSLYEKPANKFVAGFIGSPPMNFINGALKRRSNEIYFSSDEFEIKLDGDANWRNLRNLENLEADISSREATLGIRPEDVIVDRSPNPLGNPSESEVQIKIKTVVEVVEPLGSETILYLTSGLHSIIAKVDSHIIPKVNTIINVSFNAQKVHLFDKESGMAIGVY